MKRELRRQERKMAEAEAFEILKRAEHGVLSICTTENEGYGIPLNFVFDGEKIYFHCATEGAKLDYLRKNNNVSFCVVGRTQVLPSKFGTLFESVIVAGSVSEIEGDEKRAALRLLIEKYSADFLDEGKEYIQKLFDRTTVLELAIESISGKERK